MTKDKLNHGIISVGGAEIGAEIRNFEPRLNLSLVTTDLLYTSLLAEN